MADTPDASAAAEAEASSEAAAPAAPPKPAFALKTGAKVRVGKRLGKVKVLRGAGKIPYEVQVVWDDSKYPEWLQYGTLKMYYETDKLEIL
ncbi:MAG: hypothetical protein AAF517_02645 [Planctomycetota bacterium]